VLETYVIHVTKECNCNCLYCYEEDKVSTYKWDGDLKIYIDELLLNNKLDCFNIEFLGGEPLLAFDLIVKTYNYIESKSREQGFNVDSYMITTNGTIINNEIISFLKRAKVLISLSIDGDLFSNQLRLSKENDTNTHDEVIKTIEILKQNDIQFGVHLVVHHYNVHLLCKNIIYLHNIGATHIGIGTVEKTMVIDDKYCELFLKGMREVSDYITENGLTTLRVNLFESIKPYEDERTYMYNGDKVIGESYGRASTDITNVDSKYKVMRCNEKSDIYNKIYSIREESYLYHMNKKGSN